MSNFGICQLTLIPIRKESAERSEMVSQLLFGETVDILKTKGSWSYIRCHLDDYQGWVTTKMLTPFDDESFNRYRATDKVYLKEPFCRVSLNDDTLPVLYLAGGSTLPEENNQLILTGHMVVFDHVAALHRHGSEIDIPGVALKFLNAPYLWGGRTIFGIDCSGFTQIVFKMNGLILPRDTHHQAALGKTIYHAEEAEPGDLAFFGTKSGRIYHTGIILENSKIIHSSGNVHIDNIDNKGIWNVSTRDHSHKLIVIKRIM